MRVPPKSSSPESISHIRRDLLDRPVRKYADNLIAQLYAIWKQYEVKTLDDFKRLAQEKKIPEQVVRQYKDLISRLSEVVRSGKLPDDYPVVEYKEHTLYLNEVLKSSRDFYSSHNPQALADAIPDTPDALTDAQRDRITFALEQGFTSALILPDVSVQTEHLDAILEQTANTPSDKLIGETTPYLDPEAKKTSSITAPLPPTSFFTHPETYQKRLRTKQLKTSLPSFRTTTGITSLFLNTSSSRG